MINHYGQRGQNHYTLPIPGPDAGNSPQFSVASVNLGAAVGNEELED